MPHPFFFAGSAPFLIKRRAAIRLDGTTGQGRKQLRLEYCDMVRSACLGSGRKEHMRVAKVSIFHL